jgi:recombination protein RecA
MSFIDEIKEKYGNIGLLSEFSGPTTAYSTGVTKLDIAIGIGGVPGGRITELVGPEHCLAWDTFISYSVLEKDGRVRNKKGGTIERLYERFHGETCNFYVSSINEEDCIFKNRIVDVVKTGVKECYKVVTVGGHEIVCTGDHGFYVGNGSYVKAATLEVGDTVFILNHNALRFKAVPGTIESINPIGKVETYDIKCLAPYNNFIANKFVVHNSGKTSTAKSIVARLHNTSDEQALWIDTENALDEKYALKMGIDPDRLVIFYPETGERALEIAEGGIRSGEFAVVVLDSVAALSPRAEMEGDMGDAHVGLQARLMSQFVRKTAFAIRESEVAMVATNQLRDRIARIPLPPETPAGRALRHHSSLRIVLKNAGPIEQNNEIVGSKIEFLVKKNKVGAPYGTGAFEIWHDRGICLEADLLDTAVGLGVIKQKGAWFSHGENVLAQGRVAAIKALSDKEKYQEILQEIKDAETVNGS